MARLFLLWGLLIVCTTGLAEEHPACLDAYYDYTAQDSDGLRQIAASCEKEAISDLFYLRAYHAELMAEARILEQLIPYGGQESEAQVKAASLYMALVEELSRIWYVDGDKRLGFLIAEYQRQNEVLELRLHGFDHLADRLQQQVVRANQ